MLFWQVLPILIMASNVNQVIRISFQEGWNKWRLSGGYNLWAIKITMATGNYNRNVICGHKNS